MNSSSAVMEEPVGEDEERLPVVETEEVLAEELEALNQLGEWEAGLTENQDVEPVAAPTPVEPEYDFPITHNKHVEFYLDLFQNQQRRYFARWLARSAKYVPAIQKELKEAGLPQDLAYLAMIESGFNPSAYSRAHACGLWQFIRSTGRNYGLRVDSWVDERRDPPKATKAAIAYLTNLYREFDDWYLAVAAYNAGEGKIRRGIKKYKTRDFWQLAGKRYLRLETKRYVPKLIAAILIAKNPEKYGFTDIEPEQPVVYDTVSVPALTNLAAVAMTCDSDVPTLKRLNNELRKDMVPPGRAYDLRVPAGRGDEVVAKLPLLHPIIGTAYNTHIVRSGDTISSICRRYKLNKTTLLKANELHSAKLTPGQRLRIPYRTTKYVLLKKGESPQGHFAADASGGQLILHEIQRGETVSRIAKRYQVPPEMIMHWNGLRSIHKIRAGQQLALYLDQDETFADEGIVVSEASSSVPSLSDRKKNKPTGPKAARKQNTYYFVRNGDSLWTIARKFQISTGELKRWNNLRSNMIRPGEKLVVKKG